MLRLRDAALFAVLVGAPPAAVWAHSSSPPYIAFWGPFPAAAARCQRQIGASVRRCVERVLEKKMTCVPGAPNCSDAEVAAAQAHAIADADSEVSALCSAEMAQTLLFRDLTEVMSDIALACTQEPQTLHAM